jgi:hypothetical protein
MSVHGAIRKFIVNGLERTLSGDNDPAYTKGGRYISEKQETNNGKPVFIVDVATGVMSGLEERVSHVEGTLKSLDDAMKLCGEGTPVSCSVIFADGYESVAAGGAMVLPDNAADGMSTIREGKVAYSVHPNDGYWT